MAVRNFYLKAQIDGRETLIGSGPRSRDGGMDVYIYQRHNCGGSSYPVLKIYSRAFGDKLITYVVDEEGNTIKEIETVR